MARLFIFAIGGTGSRVLKSLAMILAAGVKPNTDKQYEIVPIIIDPHKANEDLKRTVSILNNYQEINKSIGNDNGFFGTKVSTLENIIPSNTLSSTFTFNLQETSDKKFRDYIDYNSQSKASQSLSDLLFSGETINKRGDKVDLLDIEMDIGFIGNPNIGSVVLNQFKDSIEFKEFASNFNEQDRIFIISSIFGGTGAAGFPIILKNIRGAINNQGIDGKGFLQNSKIGAITVLPYFNIAKNEGSPIQKSDFIAKSKSALYYYKDNVTGNNSVNALYYIADDFSGKPYKNDPGDQGQKNDAHFVELASALSIIDFLEIPDHQLQTAEGKARNPIYREFGIKKDIESVNLPLLGNSTQNRLNLPLSQFYLFRKYIKEQLPLSIDEQVWSNNEPCIGSSFLSTKFYKNYLSEFFVAFDDWIKELSENRRGFKPFVQDAILRYFIQDIETDYGLFMKKFGYKYFDASLNKNSRRKDLNTPEAKFIKLFHITTEEILKKKFSHFKNMSNE